MMLELPHTTGCLVCGRDNPHGLKLTSQVDPDTGVVSTTFTPASHHIGFEGIIHGGVLATVADELMVWASIWACKKACVAVELSLRFVQKATPGRTLRSTAQVTRQRSRMLEASAEIFDGVSPICTATGKYMPMGPAETSAFHQTLIQTPDAMASIAQLIHGKI